MNHKEQIPYRVAQEAQLLGARVRQARVRRNLGQMELAQSCQMARATLQRIEAGSPGVAIGTIFTVLWTLGLLSTASGLADPDADEHGKTLEAARLPKRVRESQTQPEDNNF